MKKGRAGTTTHDYKRNGTTTLLPRWTSRAGWSSANRHPRFKLHFTPTSASWPNLVERSFAEITTKSIRRGTFASVAELEEAIHRYLDRRNADPKPFIWTKTAA